MLRNYITIAWRSLLKQKLFSVINITGLAIGLAACYLIMLFILEEYSTNNWVRNADRHYFLESDWKEGTTGLEITTFAPLGKALQEKYPHLVASYFTIHARTCNVSNGVDKHFRLELQVMDGELLESFGIPLLHGDPGTALDDPNSVVIHKDVALKFFGKADVIGESLILETENAEYDSTGKKHFVVSGVMDYLPENSITDNLGRRTNLYINADNVPYYGLAGMWDRWDINIIQTRIGLQEGVTPDDLAQPMRQLIDDNVPEHMARDVVPKLTPLKSYNLIQNNGARMKMIYVLAVIAGFILVMALINFINISLGMANQRLREIGVRKVVGGLRIQLIIQFLTESVLFALLACLLALGMVQVLLPYYAGLLNKPHLFSNVQPENLYLISAIIAMTVGLLAGSYPAFVLSRQPTIRSLKGKNMMGGKGATLERILLTVQFIMAIFFLLSASVVSRQMDYFLNKDLGYDADNILVVTSLPRWWSREGVDRMLAIKNEFQKLPGVQQATLSFEMPDGRFGSFFDFRDADDPEEQYYSFPIVSCDDDYLKTYDLELVEGRFLTYEDGTAETIKVVLNETAAQQLFGESPATGRMIAPRDGQGTRHQVVGVVRDFNFGSLHEPIKGYVFTHVNDPVLYRYFSFKIEPDDLKSTTVEVEAKWREVFPQVPFEYLYMEDKLQELYVAEDQFKKALEIATLFAVGVVLIGLFGITLQNLSYRAREIGIRKVLGATLLSLWQLLTREYTVIFLISAILSVPAVYFLMENWLNGFAYRIDQSVWVYTGGILLFVLFTLLVVGIEIIRSATRNPVDSLRYE